MLWYNNPEAVMVIHDGLMRERHEDRRRRRLMRLVAGGNATERHQ
jgi:hypothetical protein